MRPKKQLFSTTLLLFLGIAIANAQQALPTTGGNAIGSGGSASYTVGQVAYTSSTGSGGFVTQGVQVPYEISVATGLETAKNISLNYSVYPNPATDYLTLKIEGNVTVKYNASLFDMNGKLLFTQIIESNLTDISMKNLAPAIYFLKISSKNKEVKTFKIIKKIKP